MEIKELVNVTDPDTVYRNYEMIARDLGIEPEMAHPLFEKGVLVGMEAVLRAMSESMKTRNRLEDFGER